jgi:rhomboid protease GluP
MPDSHSLETDHSPQKSAVPKEAFPVVSFTILAICIVVYVAMWKTGKGDISAVADWFGAKVNTRIQAGEWWRFITAMFLHGSEVHLLTNGLSLYWVGWSMERIYGSRKYLIVYLFAGIVSFAVSYWRSSHPSLGASGAIFGLIGAGLIFPLRYRSLLPEVVRSKILSQLLTTAVLNLAIGFSIPQVDNWAHIGGMVGGGFMALFLIPEVLDSRPKDQKREAVLWTTTALCCLLLLFCAGAQWRAPKPPPVPPLRYFAPQGAKPWWQIGIPQTWQQTPQGFKTPSGALLEVIDSLQYPERCDSITRLLDRAGDKISRHTVGTFPVRRVVLQQDGRMYDLCLVEAYGEAVCLVMKFPKTGASRGVQEMSEILQNMEILHDPKK